jgi:hypothetical protein
MPIIYVHGVNTRKSNSDYARGETIRGELIQKFLCDPLTEKGDRFKDLKIINPYWGDDGVSFAWNRSTVPDVQSLDYLGPEDTVDVAAISLATTVSDLQRERDDSQLEKLGGSDTPLKDAAMTSLPRFLEAVVAPALLKQAELTLSTPEVYTQPETVGLREALLLVAIDEVAHDPDTAAAVAQVGSDRALMELLKERTLKRFEVHLQERNLWQPASETSELETLGSDSGNWFGIFQRIGEFFDRATDAPGRVSSLAVLSATRDLLHDLSSRFFGDVFVYLQRRGTQAHPGPILRTIVDALENSPRHHPDEPLIVLTHSMGGNILYDILTYYRPDLKVDFWASVGGQVGQFEEMKLFQASNPTLGTPEKVQGVLPNLGYWVNIYDPADPFSFKAKPVFAELRAEEKFLTGENILQSHGAYFFRPSFYDLLRQHLDKAFP